MDGLIGCIKNYKVVIMRLSRAKRDIHLGILRIILIHKTISALFYGVVLLTKSLLRWKTVDTFTLCTLDHDILLGSIIYPEACLESKIWSVHHNPFFVPGRSSVGAISSPPFHAADSPRTPRNSVEYNHTAVVGKCILLKLLHPIHTYTISNQTASRL